MKGEIEVEKHTILEKKRKEREICQKIISDNEIVKQKLAVEKDKEKEMQNKLMEDYNKMIEEQEKKRALEWAKKEERIQGLMNKMADSVVAKNNAAEKEIERRGNLL